MITSRSNPKVKQARLLRQRKARAEQGLFLVEGIRHVGEAAEAGADIQALFYSPDLLSSSYANQLIQRLEQQQVECLPVSEDVFASLAEKENPQGILAVLRQKTWQLQALDPQTHPWLVAAVEPQDPGNVGTILRTIDAAGASGLILLNSSVDVYHPSVVRASMGALFWYPLVQASFDEFAAWAKSQGYTLYGTSSRGSLDYRAVPHYSSPCILLLGSEREGLTPEQSAACHTLISLPMRGRATSLNLAIAAGVFLYEMLAKSSPSHEGS